MKIALLTDGIHPHVIGGIQKHSYYLAKYFAQNKIEVDLYHPRGNLNEKSFFKNCFTPEESVYIHPVLIDFPKLPYFPGHYIYESYLFSKNIFQKYIRVKPTDFIYAQGFTGWKFLKQKTSKKYPLPPIGVNFHGLNMFQPAFGLRNRLNNILFRPCVKYNLQHADRVFSLGGKLTELIHQNTKITKDVIEVPVGIDESWISIDLKTTKNELLKFVFVGRYDKVKGIELLNSAIQNNSSENNLFTFDFIGPIPGDKQLKNSNINYYGEIKNTAELKNIIKGCDVIVSSSYSEGMPTAILEAMACGLAVIATDVGALRELVDKENGILVTTGNVSELQTAIHDFINMNPGVLAQMKKNSIEKVRHRFLWKNIILQTIAEIQKISAPTTK
ncbi:MAG: glycosyltransferase family 4 protein [Bacteroidota bacterium]